MATGTTTTLEIKDTGLLQAIAGFVRRARAVIAGNSCSGTPLHDGNHRLQTKVCFDFASHHSAILLAELSRSTPVMQDTE